MTSRTIFPNGQSNPIEPTRDMHLLYQKMMEEFGKKLLSSFVNEEKEKRFAVLTGIRDFCVDAEYPKDLLAV
jgi:hypothetical protein